MVKVQQRVLITFVLLTAATAAARTFYEDDPLWQAPKPMKIESANNRKLSDIYDFFYMTFGKPGEKQLPGKPIRAGEVNTLGEVPDSTWYTNRHWKRRMSIEELVRGPGNTNPPATDSPWRVVAAKTEGVTPGFTIKDSKGRSYQIKFDTRDNFEQATGADVMAPSSSTLSGTTLRRTTLSTSKPINFGVGDAYEDRGLSRCGAPDAPVRYRGCAHSRSQRPPG